MADLIQFDLGSGARIGRAVRIVESMRPPAKPLTFDPIIESQRRQKKETVFAVGTFSGAWAKGASKSVTITQPTSLTAAISAVNLFAPVPAPPGAGYCAVAKAGPNWYLIAAECV